MCKKICDTCDYSLPYGKDYVNCEKIKKIVEREFSCKYYNNENFTEIYNGFKND